MYLEMIKGEDVYIYTNNNNSSFLNQENLIHTRLFKLIEVCKLLGAKSVKILNNNDDLKDKIIIEYYDSNYDYSISDFIYNSAKLCLSVYWDSCNRCLSLNEIWYNGNKVGFYENISDNECEINEVLLSEEYLNFDIVYNNFDFTKHKLNSEYIQDSNGDIHRVDNFIKS